MRSVRWGRADGDTDGDGGSARCLAPCLARQSRVPGVPGPVCHSSLFRCYNFSTASRAHLRRATPTAGTGHVSWREQPGEERSGLVTGDKWQGSPGVSPLRGGPDTAGAGPRRHGPMSCHTSRARPSCSRRVRRSPYERSQPPGRNAAHCPGRPLQRQRHPRSFLTASQKGSSGPTLERRSLCRPSGPDGEGQARGQARNARGEPPQRGTYRDARLTARQSTIFYAVDPRLGSWSTVSGDVPGGT
jgi:hypothetical protein